MKSHRKRRYVLALGITAVLTVGLFACLFIFSQKVTTAQISPRDAELTEAVLRYCDPQFTGYLTPTPQRRWGVGACWQRYPESFHARLSNLQAKYVPADGAYLLFGSVRSRTSQQRGWIRWVTIIEWISDTEAVVEDGVWSCQLGGGAFTYVWEYKDGEWQFKELRDNWTS